MEKDSSATGDSGRGEESAALDPRDAAKLLEATTAHARQSFQLPSPFAILVAAATVAGAYGAVWLSVRNQNPYSGPSLTALAELYGLIALGAIVVGWDVNRAMSGVDRKPSRLATMRGIAFGSAVVSLYLLMGALRFDGFTYAIVYGILPAAGPLIVGGAAVAGYAAAREDRPMLAFAIVAMAVGAGAAFFGPSGVWAVVGAGFTAMLVFGAVVQARMHGRWTLGWAD